MPRAVVVVLSLVVASACGSGGDDDAEAARVRAGQAREVARAAGLAPAVQNFLADAAGAVGETYTIVYSLGAEGGTDGGRSTVVQDPPRRRVEFELEADGVPVIRVFISNDDGTFGCARLAGEWACQRNAERPPEFGPLAVGDVQEATQDLIEARADYDFRIERRRLAGVTARCLVTARKPGRPPDPSQGERGTLCISPEGVPLLVEASSGTLTATRYRTSADSSSFRLPAAPDPAPVTTTTGR